MLIAYYVLGLGVRPTWCVSFCCENRKCIVDSGHFRNGCVIAHSFSAGASLNETLQNTAIGAQFSGDLFSRHTILNNDCFSRHCARSLSVWALSVALSSLTLPLCQRIRPFTANKALSGRHRHANHDTWPSRPKVPSNCALCICCRLGLTLDL